MFNPEVVSRCLCTYAGCTVGVAAGRRRDCIAFDIALKALGWAGAEGHTRVVLPSLGNARELIHLRADRCSGLSVTNETRWQRPPISTVD